MAVGMAGARTGSIAVPAVLENGRLAQYCPLWPWNGVSGLGQNARTTGGAGILPAAILREARLMRPMLTALDVSSVLMPMVWHGTCAKPSTAAETATLQDRRDGCPPLT